jgi:hypothetical protein
MQTNQDLLAVFVIDGHIVSVGTKFCLCHNVSHYHIQYHLSVRSPVRARVIYFACTIYISTFTLR